MDKIDNSVTIKSGTYVTAKRYIELLAELGYVVSPQVVTNWKRRGLIEIKNFPEFDKDLIKLGSNKTKKHKGI